MNYPNRLDPAAITAILEKLDSTNDPASIRADLKALIAAANAAPVNPDPVLDPDQAAEYIGATPRMVRLFAQQKRIPIVRIGKLLRFRQSDLDAWLTAGGGPGRGPAM